MFFLLFVLHDMEYLDAVLSAWEEVGVSGVTILASTGLARLRGKSALREALPLIPSLEDILEQMHDTNRTLFTIIKTQELVDQVVAATQRVVGDLEKPNTGILVVLPILQAYGLNRRSS